MTFYFSNVKFINTVDFPQKGLNIMGFWSSPDHQDTDAMTPEEQAQKDAQITRRSRKINLIALVVVIAVFLIYTMFFQKPSITAVMDDKSFVLAPLEGENIILSLTDVDSVELGNDLSAFDKGTLQSGTEDTSCCSGVYVNDALGEYQLQVNLDVEPYVIVRYTDGILVFNTDTQKGTTELYTNLLNAVNG